MNSTTIECQICVNKYNNCTRKCIKCMYCGFEACSGCCKKYILQQSSPQCMNTMSCGREWTRKFLSAEFAQSFVAGEYKIHRENVLLEQERALFIETQPYVEKQIKCEKNIKKYREIQDKITALYKKQTELMNENRRLMNKKTIDRAVFVRACGKDGCNGFLNQQWKCGICESVFCKDCHQCVSDDGKKTDSTENAAENANAPEYVQQENANVGDEPGNIMRIPGHACNPDNVATAQLLERDTKPCPKCNMGIFKIDGCNQMFCTNCNTAFDWITRKIANGIIHNPHYFEWLRRSAENAANTETAANMCPVEGNELTNEMTRIIVQTMNRKTIMSIAEKNNTVTHVTSIIRNVIHIRYIVIPTYTFDYVEKNRELRISFMRNTINENEFKFRVQKNDKKYSKSQEILNVLQLLVNACTDIVYRFLRSIQTSGIEWTAESENIFKEFECIINYSNSCLFEISTTYKSRPLVFSSKLDMI